MSYAPDPVPESIREREQTVDQMRSQVERRCELASSRHCSAPPPPMHDIVKGEAVRGLDRAPITLGGAEARKRRQNSIRADVSVRFVHVGRRVTIVGIYFRAETP